MMQTIKVDYASCFIHFWLSQAAMKIDIFTTSSTTKTFQFFSVAQKSAHSFRYLSAASSSLLSQDFPIASIERRRNETSASLENEKTTF